MSRGSGTMPGASYYLEWIDDDRSYNPTDGQKGVWLLVNTTETVYEYARNAGNFREEVWGDVNETYIGSENPASCRWQLAHATSPLRLSRRSWNSTRPSVAPASVVGLPAELSAAITAPPGAGTKKCCGSGFDASE